MDDIIAVRGIILKHSPSGDYDWVATIFTRERGKITELPRDRIRIRPRCETVTLCRTLGQLSEIKSK